MRRCASGRQGQNTHLKTSLLPVHHIKAAVCEWNFYQSAAITFVLLEMTASKLLTIAVQLQLLWAGRSSTSLRGGWRGGEPHPVFRAQAIYWWLDSWIKRHAATNDHMDFAASMAALDSTWFHPCGAETGGWSALKRGKAALSLVDWFIFLLSCEG